MDYQKIIDKNIDTFKTIEEKKAYMQGVRDMIYLKESTNPDIAVKVEGQRCTICNASAYQEDDGWHLNCEHDSFLDRDNPY
jgi:hypothetical protein